MPTFLKYILIIAIILIVAFFSQQVVSGGFAKTFVYDYASKAKATLSKGYNSIAQKTISKADEVGGQVASGGEAIKQGVEEKKKDITENISTKVSNYFSGIGNALVGKSTADNCPAIISTTTPSS